jgi:hypothetical protein
MATTYLDITNEVLRELNELPLTQANFASAVGLQQFVKDAVNKSIFDIANEEPQLPFLSAGVSGLSTCRLMLQELRAQARRQRYYSDCHVMF